MLNAGFKKRAWVNGAVVETNELPDVLKNVVRAQATALFGTWRDWAATQTVTIPITAPPGAPSLGKLLP